MSSCCKTKVCFGFIGEAFATSAGSIAIRDERRNLRRSIIRLFFPKRRGQDHRTFLCRLHRRCRQRGPPHLDPNPKSARLGCCKGGSRSQPPQKTTLNNPP